GREVSRPDTSPRLAAVWFPGWAAEVMVRREAGDGRQVPLAVLRANRVLSVTPAAAAEGIRPGLRRREAQSRCPTLEIRDHDADAAARAFEEVTRSVGELVPVLEVTEPGTLTFATRGPSRYAGGDESLGDRVHALAVAPFEGATPPVGVGIADGRFAATVAARRSARLGRPLVVAPGGSPAFLAPFSIPTLTSAGGIEDELVDLLRRLGVRRLGDLAALPAADLLARFGPFGAHAHALAAGLDPGLPDAAPPPPELVAERSFEAPVTSLQPLVFVAKQLADELAERLGAHGMVVVRLVVVAETEYGERTERVWYRAAGMNAVTMAERVRWQLDGWVQRPGGLTGGVELLRLVPAEVRAADGRQLGFWGGATQADDSAMRAATRLVGLLGPEAVLVPEWRGGREPGDAYSLVSAALAELGEPDRHRTRVEAPVTSGPHRPAAGPVTGSAVRRSPPLPGPRPDGPARRGARRVRSPANPPWSGAGPEMTW
ncbi:MAG: hypothetical protein R2705_11595, partial [Ilumatobacteraceae bacterium]